LSREYWAYSPSSILAGQIGTAVILRERHVHVERLAGFGADQLVLETGNELVGAELNLNIVAGAAVERFAVDLADEFDDADVALVGGARGFHRLALLVLLG
jgi:hypothetical protein